MKTLRISHLASASRLGTWLGLIVLALVLTGCGKQAYNTGYSVEAAQPAQTYQIPIKVDVLLGMNDAGSMYTISPTVKQQMTAMLTSLNSQGWDYHFATIPLTTVQPIQQVMVSDYDDNFSTYGLGWVAPYPGATPANTGGVNSAFFSTLSNPEFLYNDYLNINPSNITNAAEAGIQNITTALTTNGSNLLSSGFLRSDAFLVTVVVSDQDDTSTLAQCNNAGSGAVPMTGNCRTICSMFNSPTCTTWKNAGGNNYDQSLFNNYLNQLKGIKPGQPGALNFYSVVAGPEAPNCAAINDSGAILGDRYMLLASDLGGNASDLGGNPNLDICQPGAMSNVVFAIGANLSSTQENALTRIVVISQQPNLCTLSITATTASGSTQTIPACPSNGTEPCADGWQYLGQTTAAMYSVQTPQGTVLTNNVTGYLIQLSGPSELQPGETADVTYQPGTGTASGC